MSRKWFCPYSLPDWIRRLPAPTRRSNKVWVNVTSLIRSSGISIDRFASQPERWITRSVVTTKCDVIQARKARMGYQEDGAAHQRQPPDGRRRVEVSEEEDLRHDRQEQDDGRTDQCDPVRPDVQ